MVEKERGTYAERSFSQAMKSGDAFIAAWEETLARKGDAAADFRHARRRVVNVSRDRRTGTKVRAKIWCERSGRVNAIQIGNHPDWPARFIASLRERLPVLPLDKTVSAQERDNAIAICNKGAETDWNGRPPTFSSLPPEQRLNPA